MLLIKYYDKLNKYNTFELNENAIIFLNIKI